MLHGEIKVNGTVIGDWKASRVGPRDHKDRGTDKEEYVYRCALNRRMEDGKEFHERFEVRHFYADGAIELANKVHHQAVLRGVL